jgi:hypothetical protein
VTLNIRRMALLSALVCTLIVTVVYSQQPQPSRPGKAATHQPPPNGASNVTVGQSSAARYSPLAAQGGYRGQRMTWYDALLHSLNPKDIDWGMSWEQRRAIFLENTVANKYFVFCAFLVLCFYAALLAIGWIIWDHKKDIRYFETELVKGRNWALYWKARAVEAISKHNAHIEKCNRVIEAGETGVPLGDAAEAVGLHLELERTRTELQNVTSEKLRLKGELEEKARTITELSFRVDEVTKRIGNGSHDNRPSSTPQADDKVALIARINRLESALAAATQENRRLKGA